MHGIVCLSIKLAFLAVSCTHFLVVLCLFIKKCCHVCVALCFTFTCRGGRSHFAFLRTVCRFSLFANGHLDQAAIHCCCEMVVSPSPFKQCSQLHDRSKQLFALMLSVSYVISHSQFPQIVLQMKISSCPSTTVTQKYHRKVKCPEKRRA